MKKITLLVAVGILTLLSCTKQQKYRLSKLDIVDAKSLFLGKAKSISTNGSANDSSTSLFKKDGNNYIQTVSYTWVNSSGKEVSRTETISPIHLYNFNEKYLYTEFKSGDDKAVHNYLIDTQTGDSYVFPDEAGVHFEDPFSDTFRGVNFWSDKNGNIYFIGIIYSDGWYGICRTNLSNPEDLKLSILSLKDVPSHGSYAVDDDGNCFYEGIQKDSSRHMSYLITNDGISHKLDEEIYHYFWRGYDGEIYDYMKKDNTGEYWLYKWEVVDNTAKKTEIKKLNWNCLSNSFLFLNDCKKIYSFGYSQEDYEYIPHLTEVYDNQKTESEKYPMVDVNLLNCGLTESYDFRVSNDYIYILGVNNSGNEVIVKVDPATNQAVPNPIVLSSEYEVITQGMHVSKNNIITFEAKRISDQSYIIGTINANEDNPTIEISTTVFADNVKSLILI